MRLQASRAEWLGYLSSTGVYGDWRGGWVDEECVLMSCAFTRMLSSRHACSQQMGGKLMQGQQAHAQQACMQPAGQRQVMQGQHGA